MARGGTSPARPAQIRVTECQAGWMRPSSATPVQPATQRDPVRPATQRDPVRPATQRDPASKGQSSATPVRRVTKLRRWFDLPPSATPLQPATQRNPASTRQSSATPVRRVIKVRRRFDRQIGAGPVRTAIGRRARRPGPQALESRPHRRPGRKSVRASSSVGADTTAARIVAASSKHPARSPHPVSATASLESCFARVEFEKSG